MLRRLLIALPLVACAPVFAGAPDTSWVRTSGGATDFALAGANGAAPIVVAASDAKVVQHAVRDLAADVERVTGRRPALREGQASGPAVLVGTLGKSALADRLAAGGKLDLAALRGKWESFVIATIDDPLPGVPRALVIVGSDPRGTAYGVYELAQAMGVSPWTWWADVAPAHKDAVFVAAGLRRFGPPSVKYRGIFLNDEDWGLRPWAAQTHEPERGNIGPNTYTRLFELLLRLKANTLWPAMHPGTAAFNSAPENAALADEYGIVMGSSHAEPMLRNNVDEWKGPAADFDYQANPEGVQRYWEARVAANGRYENLWTVGMRGIHDSAMQGPKQTPARVALLERIFADQRAMLARHVNPRVEQVPQLFVPYKEVLAQYRRGLKVPDDVTIMWTDDNFGYVRDFATRAERSRAGGFGVYYHISYLGAPMSYLWLGTTPPALIWEEMRRSHDAGADRVWILNVGDLKPAEIGTEFFMRMAWDVGQWGADAQPVFLQAWAAREFGARQAGVIAAVMGEYYRLNFRRRPEHLQWWLPKEAPRPSGMSAAELDARLRAFVRLRERVAALASSIAPARRDAWFELVAYPVTASALANERFIEGERGNRAAALAADARLDKLTARWNTDLAGGKWRHMMAQEPADQQWRSFRLNKWSMPAYATASVVSASAAAPAVTLEAERFDVRRAGRSASWHAVPGLGTSGEGAVTLAPSTQGDAIAPGRIAADAPRLDYRFRLARGGAAVLRARMLPTHPSSGTLRFAVALDEGAPQLAELPNRDGDAEWAQGVLDNMRTVSATLGNIAPGAHTLRVYGIDPGVVIDRLDIVTGKGAARSP
jgi:hypothetical protein